MTAEVLMDLAREAVRDMPIPTTKKELYPRIHNTAYAIAWPNKAEALGSVFRVICDAVGIKFGSQYMAQMLDKSLADGSLERGIRAIRIQPLKDRES